MDGDIAGILFCAICNQLFKVQTVLVNLHCGRGFWQVNRLDAKMDQALQLLTILTRSFQAELDANHKEPKQ